MTKKKAKKKSGRLQDEIQKLKDEKK